MDTVDSVEKSETRTCPHLYPVEAQWVKYDDGAPVLALSDTIGPCLITMSKRIVVIQCAACFKKTRSSSN